MDEHDLSMFRLSVVHTLETTPARELRDRLEDEGWFDLFAEDPQVAVGTLFEEQGRSLANSGMLDDVLLAELPGTDQPAGPRLVVYPLPNGSGALSSVVEEQGGEVAVAGLTSRAPAASDVLVVPVRSSTGPGLFTITVRPEVTANPVAGLDPDARRHRVDERFPVTAGTVVALSPGSWDKAVAAGRRAAAHELVGVTEKMLAMAVDHVTNRHQFGRALGAFQAVQQRLADVYIAQSAAGAAIRAAWKEPEGLVAAMAKSLAAAAHATAARECQQVMGGIGFTWEHPLHRYVRRGYALDALLGSARELEREVGERLVGSAQVPRLPFAIA